MLPQIRSLRTTWPGLIAIVLAALLVLSACGDESEVAEERDAVPSVTPVALDALPEGVEVVDVLIQDGEFQTDEIILQENEPTVLRISNQDDQRYALEIGDILTPAELEPNEVTTIEMTTPLPEEYVGELLTEDEEEVVDTIPVLVVAPGRTDP